MKPSTSSGRTGFCIRYPVSGLRPPENYKSERAKGFAAGPMQGYSRMRECGNPFGSFGRYRKSTDNSIAHYDHMTVTLTVFFLKNCSNYKKLRQSPAR